MRVGIGYDSHRFARGRPLRLGGVTIPSARGLAGHSDADVLLHAVADALFGAVGAPELGEQFPSSDPRYRHMESTRCLQRAMTVIRRRGWAVSNLDAVIIADAPRLSEYKPKIRRRISELLAVTSEQVSIKAKTSEGFCPRQHGMMAHAVVLLKRVPRATSRRKR